MNKKAFLFLYIYIYYIFVYRYIQNNVHIIKRKSNYVLKILDLVINLQLEIVNEKSHGNIDLVNRAKVCICPSYGKFVADI